MPKPLRAWHSIDHSGWCLHWAAVWVVGVAGDLLETMAPTYIMVGYMTVELG